MKTNYHVSCRPSFPYGHDYRDAPRLGNGEVYGDFCGNGLGDGFDFEENGFYHYGFNDGDGYGFGSNHGFSNGNGGDL